MSKTARQAVFAFDDALRKAFVKNEANGKEECVDEAIASNPAESIPKISQLARHEMFFQACALNHKRLCRDITPRMKD